MFWFSENHFEILAKSRKNHENDIEGDGIWNPIENQGISSTISNDIFLDVIFRIFWDFAQISKWFFENQNIIFFDDLKKKECSESDVLSIPHKMY